MNNRQRLLAALYYEPYDRLPILHFGFWPEVLGKWVSEGHLTQEELNGYREGAPSEEIINRKLGFDTTYHRVLSPNTGLAPQFETEVLEVAEDGTRKVRNYAGVTILQKDGCDTIPAEVDHLLKDRASWQEHYRHRLQYIPERVDGTAVPGRDKIRRLDKDGIDWLKSDEREDHILLHCGSLLGTLRDYVGVTGLSYITADDEELLDEMIGTIAELCFQCASDLLSRGATADIGHFWEDICFKNGPLVNPQLFKEKIGPHYKRITDLLYKHGIDLVSLDCDGCIDKLIPTWIENGVNVMFPIEVGTWHAEIKPWREQYGRQIRGVGGMDKKAFAQDYKAVDAEIERLKPLVELGGFIPCPDHRISPDAVWENVQYYCDRMRETFVG